MTRTRSDRPRLRLLAATGSAIIAATAATSHAQEGMLYTAVNIGGTTTQNVMIYENGSWSTLFTRPFCVDGSCASLIFNLAVDENARRVYWMNGVDLEYWDIDAGTIHQAHGNVLLPGQRIRSLAFNPDDGLLYAIKYAETAAVDDELLSIDPTSGATQSIMSIDDETYVFSTFDYNRADNTFYAYRTLAGSDDGLYTINVLGDHSITRVADDPWGGFVAVGATVRGDEMYVTRGSGSPFPAYKGAISTGGPPWTEFGTQPNPSGTERGTAMAWWLFPPEPDCPADLANDDNVVDVFDLFVLLNNWGTSGAGADLAAPSDIVDVFDLFELLSVWGPCN